MIKRLLKVAISLLFSPSRMAGRSLKTEFFCRLLGGIFDDGEQRGAHWLRAVLAKPALPAPVQQQVQSDTHSIANVPCLIVISNQPGDEKRLIIYIHGGGFVMGAAAAYHPLLSEFAVRTRDKVIAPDYRLSPENPFPIPQQDCLAVVQRLIADNPQLNISLAGDSAGGNLCVSTFLGLSESERRRISKLYLISPWVEPFADSGSVLTHEASDILRYKFLQKSIAAHSSTTDTNDAGLNLLYADLSALPKTYIQAGGGELFIDQIQRFDQRARDAGVNCQLEVYATQFHDFQLFFPQLPDAADAVAKASAFLGKD